jgi:hypothetical protein
MARANELQWWSFKLADLDRAIDDPLLAEAMSTLRDLPAPKWRQMIFANKLYTTLLLGYRVQVVSRAELLDAIRVLSRNEIFAEYWNLTADHRGLLTADSLEARIGRAVDAVMQEPEGELEEWWVVDTVPDQGRD